MAAVTEDASADPARLVSELRRQLAICRAERDEAAARETATAEVLRVINTSPGDLGPVFQVILEKAHALCGIESGGLVLFDGEHFRLVANHAMPERHVENVRRPYRAAPGSAQQRLLRGERFVHIEDVRANPTSPQNLSSIEAGTRTLLLVPLRKEGALLGFITSIRREVRPFSEKEIALLESFAAQAVIAMENARLITETHEALEQQTATAEVLGIINCSPGDLTPVFDAMLEKALDLCRANLGFLYRYDEEAIHLLAYRGELNATIESLYQPLPIEPNSAVGALASGDAAFIHNPDITDDEIYRAGTPSRLRLVEVTGARTALWVAMRKDQQLIGVIIIYRREVRLFGEKQIALLQNFAAQAVIAMENARLLTETREALEKQTATAEILRVISSSPTDVQPTFDAIAASAVRICGAVNGGIFRFDGSLIHFAAHHGWTPEELEAVARNFPLAPGRQSVTARAILSREVAQVADISADPEFALTAIAQSGIRATLSVPMLKDGAPLGAITVTRYAAEPFTEAQIDLLKTFADQAVIAIETVRLFTELNRRTRDLQEALEYQTATSDVLKVISRSTFDLQPVLDTLVETATRLCGSDGAGITIREGDAYRYLATYALGEAFAAMLRGRTFVPDRGSIVGRVALTGEIVHIEDAAADPDYQVPEVVTQANMRTLLGAPLLRDGVVVGTLAITRARVEPFTERQIDLVRTFADQAVIAIENTRLLTELRESLEQQQAMAEVLGVINANPGNLQPVFDMLVEKAMTLCDVTSGGALFTYDGEAFHGVTFREDSPEIARSLSEPIRPHPGGVLSRLVDGEAVVQIADLRDTEEYRSGHYGARETVEVAGARTILFVALRKDKVLLGYLGFRRREVRPFTDKQLALLQSFAAQAVIAMDNARLLDEIRRRQAELRVTFDNMGDGVAMFDGDIRLAAWNMNFQKMLDLPDAFVATRPTLQEYFQYMEARGEYGAAAPELEAEIRRGIAIAEHESRFERTRPDGTVIEVRRNAVPGGGSVLIFSDVTERRRAEAEVRAARDAAEKALAELRQTQQQLVVQQKMAALGQLTAGIAHEIKNPLNFVNNFAALSNELLDELKEIAEPAIASLSGDKRAELNETIEMLSGNLTKIVEHGRRADNIVKGMLEHSRGVSGERRQVDLNALVEEALNLAYHGARAQDSSFNITLERNFDATLQPIELVPQDMTRVFLNLFGNGFYAAGKRAQADGGVRPVLRVTTHEAGDAVEVTVRDNGTGIPPEMRDKLFQPFFTTKPTGEGTGLGLSISYDIVAQQHGGTLTVDSEVGAFTEFTVRLPRGSATAQEGKAA